MTQIKLELAETNATVNFAVSEQFLKNYCDSIDNAVDCVFETTEQEVNEFHAIVDSVFANLTQEQKQMLLAEAVDSTDYTNLNISEVVRKQVERCVSCSLMDYYETATA